MTAARLQHLANVAIQHSIPLHRIIDPVALAVELVHAGESVAVAAALCGVNRTTLHRKIAALGVHHAV
jgi:DNA-binding protein Fis